MELLPYDVGAMKAILLFKFDRMACDEVFCSNI